MHNPTPREFYPIPEEHELDGSKPQVPSELAIVLGEDMRDAFIIVTDSMRQAEAISKERNPFRIREGSPDDVTLDFLHPEQIEVVKRYPEERWSRGFFATMNKRQMVKFNGKLAKGSEKLASTVFAQRKSYRDRLAALGDTICNAMAASHDDPEAFDVYTTRDFLTALEEMAGQLPPRSTQAMVENLHSAAIDGYKLQTAVLGHSTPFTTPRIIESLQQQKIAVRNSAPSLERLCEYGSKVHKVITDAAQNKQVYEIDRLIKLISIAKQQLPFPEGLTTSESKQVLVVEEFLITQVDIIKEAIRDLKPGLLGRQEIHQVIKRLGNPEFAKALGQKQSTEAQPIPDGLNHQINEVRDMLRGGRRLKPAKGESLKTVHEKADKLRALRDEKGERLLEPEEAGVILAITLDRFDGIITVIDYAKSVNGNNEMGSLSTEQAKVIRELKDFNLQATLSKIISFTKDPSKLPTLGEILGFENIGKIRSTIDGVIAPDEPESPSNVS
jgi:hypothetical protein